MKPRYLWKFLLAAVLAAVAQKQGPAAAEPAEAAAEPAAA